MERRKSIILTLPAEVVHLVEQLNVNPNLESSNPDPAGTWKTCISTKSINLTLQAVVALW
jgi:hypothetical protein